MCQAAVPRHVDKLKHSHQFVAAEAAFGLSDAQRRLRDHRAERPRPAKSSSYSRSAPTDISWRHAGRRAGRTDLFRRRCDPAHTEKNPARGWLDQRSPRSGPGRPPRYASGPNHSLETRCSAPRRRSIPAAAFSPPSRALFRFIAARRLSSRPRRRPFRRRKSLSFPDPESPDRPPRQILPAASAWSPRRNRH